MNLSKKPYKGCRDLFPPEKLRQDYLFQRMRQTAQLFHYQPYDGPLLEDIELYRAKSGEELIGEQVYDFIDRGQRHVAIRPEMTPSLARMIAQVHRELPKPIRWYSIPNLMRYERPQRGRLREHWQFNCDIFGAPAGEGELELLQLLIHLLESFGAGQEHFEIKINDRRLMENFFKQKLKINNEQTGQLYRFVDRYQKITHDQREQQLAAIQLSEEQKDLFNAFLEIKNFTELQLYFQNENELLVDIQQLMENLQSLNLAQYVEYDPFIVRGLDYYTGLVFEVFDKHPENRRALCGGGAYDNLLALFNEKPLNAVGFGLGDVTLKDFLLTHQLLDEKEIHKPPLLITFQDQIAHLYAKKICQAFRSNDQQCEFLMTPIKINKAFDYAQKKNIHFVVLIGQDEFNNAQFQIRNLEKRESSYFQLKEIKANLLEGL